MNAQLTPEQRAQRTDEPRIERLRRTHIVDLHSMRAIVGDLNLPVNTNTGGHYSRTNEDIRNDILRAHGERVAAIKIERVLRGFAARLRAAWRRVARLPSRLESLPMGVTMHMLDFASSLYCSHTLECVAPSLKRDLNNDEVWSERLVARWPTEGPLLLGLRPGVRPGQLYHMFARKRNLQTNIDDDYRGDILAKFFYEGDEVANQLSLVVPESIMGQYVPADLITNIASYVPAWWDPEPLDNSPDRLAFVLSLRCGSFLLRWDGTQAVCEAVLETYVDVYSELATLHVIDMKTFKCVTICKNLAAGGELDGDEGEDAYFMVPDIMRHNLPREYEDSSDLHDLEVVEGDATAEVCRMQLWLTLQAQSNNTFILKAQFLENNDSLDIPDWVTTVDQDNSDDGLAVRQLLADAIEQS